MTIAGPIIFGCQLVPWPCWAPGVVDLASTPDYFGFIEETTVTSPTDISFGFFAAHATRFDEPMVLAVRYRHAQKLGLVNLLDGGRRGSKERLPACAR